ncbi:MAG: hypothetical protein Q7S02_03215 [bacterium]|nr:hypothetical protein [bacterium]
MIGFVYIVYVFVGLLFGVAYAMLTGATIQDFFGMSVAMFACMAAPMIVGLLLVFRRLGLDEGIPFARVAYRMMLGAVGAPIVVTFASYDAALLGWKALGYALFSIRYYTCPAFLVGAFAFMVIALHRDFQRRTAGDPPSAGNAPPSSGGARPTTAPSATRADHSPRGTLQRALVSAS